MEINPGSKVCRICLGTEPDVNLTSLFGKKEKIIEKIKFVSDVDVSFRLNINFIRDNNQTPNQISAGDNNQDLLICVECLSKVERTSVVREKVEYVERFYFNKKRNSSDWKADYGFKVCRMCFSSTKIRSMQSLYDEDQQFYEWFELCFGADVRFDQVFEFWIFETQEINFPAF